MVSIRNQPTKYRVTADRLLRYRNICGAVVVAGLLLSLVAIDSAIQWFINVVLLAVLVSGVGTLVLSAMAGVAKGIDDVHDGGDPDWP